MKTKEECLAFSSGINEGELWEDINDPCVTPQEALNAMDEYAKETVVDFGKWLRTNNYKCHENGYYFRVSVQAGKQTWFTFDELFDLYQQERSSSNA